jgi:Protein of unknown function (DUF3997)
VGGMRHALLITLSLVWLAMIVACTGAGRSLFDLPGGFYMVQTDAHDYHLFKSVEPGGGGSSFVGGHITDLGFDSRYIILRRDVAEYPSHTEYRLTGAIEFWIVDIGSAMPHGPFTEREFAAARQRLGVPPKLRLESANSNAARRSQ